MYFSGRPNQQRKVDLRGRSRAEESREQILERTRAERERRQQQRLELKSAVLIQSHWRRAAAANRLRRSLRPSWSSFNGVPVQQGLQELLSTNPRILSALLYCYDPAVSADKEALAAACRGFITSAAAGSCALAAAAAAAATCYPSPAPSASGRSGYRVPTDAELSLFRVRKLAMLCLLTLAQGSPEATAALSDPYSSTMRTQQQQQPLVTMVEFLIKVVDPAVWQASVEGMMQQQQQQQQQGSSTRQGGQQGLISAAQQASLKGTQAVLRHLLSHKLVSYLSKLLLSAHPRSPGKSCAEVCTAQLVVRALQQQLLPIKHHAPYRQQADQAAVAEQRNRPELVDGAATSPGSAPADSILSPSTAVAVELGASQLLFTPNLWAKAPSLLPVAGRLCRLVLGELEQLSSGKQLADVLLLGCAHGSSGSSGKAMKATGRWRALDGAGGAADNAASSLAGLSGNLVEPTAAAKLFMGLEAYQQVVTAAQAVNSLLMVLDASRQVSELQRTQWRAGHSSNQQQQGQQNRSIYDSGSGLGASRRTQYVPGAGFAAAEAHSKQQTLTAHSDMQQEHPASSTMQSPADESQAMDIDSVGHGEATAATEAGAAAVGDSSAANRSVLAAGAAQVSQSAAPSRAADEAMLERPVAASAWSAEEHVTGDSSSSTSHRVTATEACIQQLAGTSHGLQLLRHLVALLLPETTTAASKRPNTLDTAQSSAQVPPTALDPAQWHTAHLQTAQQQLLGLIWGLSRAAAYRQKVWLSLAFGARLVPRLWYSLLLPLHLSTPGGLLYYTGTSSSTAGSLQASSADGGLGSWVMPMLIMCHAFVAVLSSTPVEDLYLPGGAPCLLPLGQLFEQSAPAAGLVLLVKAAVWQVLWFNSLSPAGLPPPTPAMQQDLQQLKGPVAEVCGLLLCQLHDRNCIRQFCPPSTFLCELALSAPARLEAEVSAAAARMGAPGVDSEDDGGGAEEDAWQQQQQWQQQRQQGLGPYAAGAGSLPGGDGSIGMAVDEGPERSGSTAAASGRVSSSAVAGGGGGGGKASGSRVWAVLEYAPCVVPFDLRVQLLQHVLEVEKEQAQDVSETVRMWDLPLEPFVNRFVTIRRDELVEDGFKQLGRMDPDRIKGRLRIQYVNEAGLPEAGIDGGGLFKDFMEELLKQGFSPQSNLMAENPQHQLFPNPAAFANYADAEHRLGFLGRMLGKCLYEGMLLELPLATFFLKKMRGGVCDVNDMPSIDPEVYKHLLQLRHYKGDLADLSLNFTATVADVGPNGAARQREVELKPGGRDITVKSDNVIEYIHRLADFRLNRQMDRAAAAFLRGFFELIKPRWVRMFNEAELQMLISGSEDGVDVDDLMRHINYAGGYHEEHPVILTLWQTLRDFTPQQQRQFLKFVTSCSRAPLLGFAYLEPRVCVQMSGGMLQPGATQRLPTAATCMNLLKLPPYRSVKEMHEKLLYAIQAGAGFELS